jgi:hypothetical protein
MFGTYNRLRVHVYASDRAVIKAASLKLKKQFRHTRKDRVARHKFYRQMLDYHHEHQDLCREFRL